MGYDTSSFKQATEGISSWLKKEYMSIRTGRATPGILDSVSVNAYGSVMPINQLAVVSIEDPRSMRVVPWDKSVVKDIDKAIRESNLGLSVTVDSDGLRVAFPELTGDRRTILTKLAREKLEEARVKVRTEREKSIGELDRREKDGKISEDQKFRLKNELQKLVDDINKKLEELTEKKEKEITE